jgi:hypothetical protein
MWITPMMSCKNNARAVLLEVAGTQEICYLVLVSSTPSLFDPVWNFQITAFGLGLHHPHDAGFCSQAQLQLQGRQIRN